MATKTFNVGDRVEAGRGHDHDTGRVIKVDKRAKVATVAWDSLVTTIAPFDALKKVGR